MSIENKNFVSAKDNSPIRDELAKKKINLDNLFLPQRGDVANLGLHKYKNQLYSSNYVGICRLKDKEGKNIKDPDDGKDMILKINPRFPLSVMELLDYIKGDDEFERYLAPQTASKKQSDQEVDSLEKNELFHFFENEPPINVNADTAKDSSIITITLFLSLLKELCRKPLMGRMIKKEENLVGKVKGKILFNKNIRANIAKGRKDRIYCQYLHFSQDIVENQFLKAALIKAKKFISQFLKNSKNIQSSYSVTISYCTKVLEHISVMNMSGRECDNLNLSGVYVYYKPVINLAKMILNEVSIDTNGKVSTTNYILPYAISMEKLFEMYIRTYLKNNGFASYKNPYSKRFQLLKYDEKWSIFEGTEKGMGDYIGGTIKPDIVIKDSQNGEYIVFDVKYKNYLNKHYVREDRLQLLAYALMFNCSHIGLIFPPIEDGKLTTFTPQVVQSLENREIKYHQLLFVLNKNNGIVQENDLNKNIAEYIKDLFQFPN
jgi:5-methylcytosine-specific restriction endonuclease McrBC regulatory subunit McrC